MPSAADFHRDHLAITNTYVILVRSALYTAGLEPHAGAGNHVALTTANYVLNFSLAPVPSTRTQYLVDVTVGGGVGTRPLYFLPWEQNAATSMTLPAGAVGPDVFITSMLSGCTVRVSGTAANPTITHANASAVYNTAYAQRKQFLERQGWEEGQRLFEASETRANQEARGAIQNMLPALGGAVHTGTVSKADYAGRATPDRLGQAQQRYYGLLGIGQRLTRFEAAKIGTYKPKTGAFVYGVRDGTTHQWAFYYQATLDVDFDISGSFGWGQAQAGSDAVVLGATTQIFP
jgi:hypothetical protein